MKKHMNYNNESIGLANAMVLCKHSGSHAFEEKLKKWVGAFEKKQ